jgi:hypothetical protein
MQVELYCSCCTCRFVAPPQASSDEVFDRMFNDGPWYALGDGETFEDMIFSTLSDHGQICCPECGEPVNVSEESLGELALSMISRM